MDKPLAQGEGAELGAMLMLDLLRMTSQDLRAKKDKKSRHQRLLQFIGERDKPEYDLSCLAALETMINEARLLLVLKGTADLGNIPFNKVIEDMGEYYDEHQD